MTMMTYVRLHASGTSQAVLHIGEQSTTALELKFENGNLVFTNGRSSISAGAISSASNSMAAGRTFDLNRSSITAWELILTLYTMFGKSPSM